MKKYVIPLILVTLFIPINHASGAEMLEVEENSEIIEEDIANDFYVAAKDNLIIEGNIQGDLFVVGGSIDVRGTVGGDLYVAGGNINIENDISGGILMAGGQLRVGGFVERTLVAAGGNITVDGEINEDLIMMGGNLNLNGNVRDDVRIAGGNSQINGEIGDDLLLSVGNANITRNIGGDVYATGGTINISSDRIGGDVVYYGRESDLVASDDLQIGGERTINEGPSRTDDFNFNIEWGELSALALILRVVWNLIQIVGLVLVGYLLVKFAPIKTDLIIANLRGFSNHLKSFAIGCIALPVGLILLIVLFISLFGIPLAKVLFALALLAMALVTPIAGLALGRLLTGWFGQRYNHLLSLFLGILVLQLLKIIPVIGDIIGFYVFFVAVGAMLRWIYQKQQWAGNYNEPLSREPIMANGDTNSNSGLVDIKQTSNGINKVNKKNKKR